MNALESQLHYPFGDQLPAPGAALPVADGVLWLRMTLPFVLDHINLWLLRDEIDGRAGWTVVDCGIAREESRAQWEQVFATQLDGLPVLRVVVTHMHPDHIGLAHWLCTRWNAPLWISATDYHVARLNLLAAGGTGGEAAAAFFRRHGLLDEERLRQVRERRQFYPDMVDGMPQHYVRLLDGMALTIGGRRWHCISGYGHAPEHIALFSPEAGVLISGDMMLPRISTNVSVYANEPEANALQLFLDSIDKFRALPQDTLTLPAHGKPFLGLHTRVGQLHDHHRQHLAEVLEACATHGPRAAMDLLPVLFKRPLDLHQTGFAMGETVAHLHKLWFDGVLRRSLDADGVYRFALAG
ncbi:MBL fold metallo-hydrolase [Pseudorhodoferax sp.]|uniref:MBL fold metallo-hydrolase n=1 Tax=Pseudorhodoferax sp. TaxID=1993553 RepID=UPI0039E34DDE